MKSAPLLLPSDSAQQERSHLTLRETEGRTISFYVIICLPFEILFDVLDLFVREISLGVEIVYIVDFLLLVKLEKIIDYVRVGAA
jgi:hypothetical protein